MSKQFAQSAWPKIKQKFSKIKISKIGIGEVILLEQGSYKGNGMGKGEAPFSIHFSSICFKSICGAFGYFKEREILNYLYILCCFRIKTKAFRPTIMSMLWALMSPTMSSTEPESLSSVIARVLFVNTPGCEGNPAVTSVTLLISRVS